MPNVYLKKFHLLFQAIFLIAFNKIYIQNARKTNYSNEWNCIRNCM